MKLNRTRPFALALSLAAAAVVFGADTTPKKKPAPAKPAPGKAAPAKPAAETKPAKPAEPAKPEAKPAAPAADAPAAATPAAAPEGAKADPVVAIVDGEDIKRSEVEAIIRQMMAQRGLPPDTLPAAQLDGMVHQMLERVVIDRIVRKACSTVPVTDADVDAELATIQKENGITLEEMTKQLKTVGKSMESLKADVRTGIQQKKWFEGKFKESVKGATEVEAKDFYDKNPQHFEQPEMVRASHIVFTLPPDATPEKVTEALKKAEAATARAKTEDFGKLAGELSQEPEAKETKGDLDFFPRQSQMPKELSEAAFKMKKDEISAAPVRTQFGYHVVKVTDRKDASKKTFEEMKAKITDHLDGQKKQKLADDLIKELRTKAKVEVKLAPPAPLAPPPGVPGAPKGAAAPPPAPAAERKPVEAVTPPVSVPAEPAPKPEPAKK